MVCLSCGLASYFVGESHDKPRTAGLPVVGRRCSRAQWLPWHCCRLFCPLWAMSGSIE